MERLNKEIAEREKENQQKRRDWEALDDNLKFYRTCEDPFKEPRITFLNGEGQEDMAPINIQETTIAESGLRAFEAAVIDEHGCYVYFDRLVPVEDEAQEESKDKKKAPAKAAPKKAKQDQNQEEAKPTHCRGWLDLTGMMHPGVKSIT
jgi:hypothetical protein